MKTKIISIMLLITLLIPNLAFATMTYTREGGEKLSNVASLITDDTWLDTKYNAESIQVSASDVHVYNYNTTTEKETTENQEVIKYNDSTKNKYYMRAGTETASTNPNMFQSDSELVFYCIDFESGEHEYNDIATFVYDQALKYNGEKYDIKLNIKSVKKQGIADNTRIMVLLGSRQYSSEEAATKYDLSTYTRQEVYPFIMSSYVNRDETSDNKIEIAIEYTIIDNSGNEIPVSGIFGVEDIDLNQGFYLDNILPNNEEGQKAGNIFIRNDTDDSNDEIMYKIINNTGTYIYSATENNRIDDLHDAYVLLEDKSKLNLNYTFDNKAAGSPVVFTNDKIKHYKKITTSVTGGTITSTIDGIKDGENKTISYTPNDSSRQYLKSITIDGTTLTDEQMQTYQSEYAFTNITEDHTIEVVYANKPEVSFDTQGGRPTPDSQYVKPGNTATEPATEPTKEGYTFEGWQNPDGTTPYDFDTPVTEDIELKAKWTPIVYNITYVTNGGTNDPSNPATYTVEDTIDFQSPTREGYTFEGWYEDEDLTTPKDGISNETGDKTVYAKWKAIEKDEDIPYKVEHYKQKLDGTYEVAVTEEDLKGKEGETVTAKAKEYTGYKENKTHENRKASGTLMEGEDLVLKLFYDLEEYKVTFNPEGGTPTPETQTVKYGDKATEPETKPTKEEYTFKYWYYISDDNEEVRYNFNDPVTSNIELHAKWNKNITPTPSTPDTSTTNTTTAGKTDTTVANKILPNTGVVRSVIMIVLAITVVLGVKYYRLKYIIK